MIFCEQCGTQLKDTAKFCYKCGTQVEAAVEQVSATTVCAKCGGRLEDGEAFCSQCGTQVETAKQVNEIKSLYDCNNCKYANKSQYRCNYYGINMKDARQLDCGFKK